MTMMMANHERRTTYMACLSVWCMILMLPRCNGFLLVSVNRRPRLDARLTVLRASRVQPHGPSPLSASSSSTTAPVPSLTLHHTALKTRNLEVALQFYSLLGFHVEAKFRAGPARAAWLTTRNASSSIRGSSCRLELIEVPSHMLQEPDGKKRRAFDMMERQDLLGWNHVALDVTNELAVQDGGQLSNWIQALNDKSKDVFGKALRIALEPRQQIIGGNVYELAFLYDADGGLVELLHKQSDADADDETQDVAQEQSLIESGWEPIDGTNFVE